MKEGTIEFRRCNPNYKTESILYARGFCDVALSTVNRWELGKAIPNMKGMKAIKSFCEDRDLDYDMVETEWLNHGIENNK